MTHTGRARVALVASPLLLPFLLLGNLLAALIAAGCEFVDALLSSWAWTCRMWYRDIWRVARYGSVWDDVNEDGHPNAWRET